MPYIVTDGRNSSPIEFLARGSASVSGSIDCHCLGLRIKFCFDALLIALRAPFTDSVQDMSVAVAALSEGASASITGVRLFLKMYAYMILSIAKLAELMVAEGASKDLV